MADKSTVGFVAGLALAGVGLVAYLVPSGAGGAPRPSETAVVQDSRPASAAADQVPVSTGALGLSESVTRVLRAEGFLGRDQAVGLPLPVRRVLAGHDAVLTVEDLR